MTDWLGIPKLNNFKGLNLRELPLNHAYLVANSSLDNIGVYSVADNCFNCPYTLEKQLFSYQSASWQVDTSSPKTYRIMNSGEYKYFSKGFKSGLLCQTRPSIQEYGVYELDIGSCNFKQLVEPVNTYLPLLLCCGIILAVWSICSLVVLFGRKDNAPKNEGLCRSKEIRSLQFLRGILILLIVITISGGGGYPVLNKIWGGLSLTDYLLMGYAWTIGFRIPIAMDQTLIVSGSKCSALKDIIKRSLVLVFVGIVIDSTVSRMTSQPDIGVIWRPFEKFGIAYFFAAFLYTFTSQKFLMSSKMLICNAMSTVISLLWCWIVSGFLVSVFIIMTSTLVSLNCQATASIQDTRAEYSNIITEVTPNCNNEVTEAANQLFVGISRGILYVNSFYGFSGGIMGTISTILVTMMGLKAGIVYLHYENTWDRVKLWLLWATLFTIGGVIFAGVSYFVDLNLWPISTIIAVGAVSFYVFTLISIFTQKLTSPILESCGVTSLIIFGGHLLFCNSFPFHLAKEHSTHLTYLLSNTWTAFLWVTIVFFFVYLPKRNIKLII